MNLVNLIVACIMMTLALSAFSQIRKKVRIIESNDQLMQDVRLTMGRSTVLSFQDKPVKVVSGNSNYFNIEFVGNDLTLQPLNQIETNLFIYTEKGLKFGFILKVGSVSTYDDMIFVKWKSPLEFLKKKEKPKKELTPIKMRILNLIEVHIIKLTKIGQGQTYLLDFEVKNISKVNLKTSEIGAFVIRSPSQELVFDLEELLPNTSSKGRLIFRFNSIQSFTFAVTTKKRRTQTVISKEYL